VDFMGSVAKLNNRHSTIRFKIIMTAILVNTLITLATLGIVITK